MVKLPETAAFLVLSSVFAFNTQKVKFIKIEKRTSLYMRKSSHSNDFSLTLTKKMGWKARWTQM